MRFLKRNLSGWKQKMRAYITIILAIAAGLAAAIPAAATPVTYNLDSEYSGSWSGAQPPEGDQEVFGPWLIATIDDVDSGVLLTMTANNLVGSEKIVRWYFNIDPQLDLNGLVFDYALPSADPVASTGPAAKRIKIGANRYSAANGGRYDLLFDFPNGRNTFTAGEEVSYLVSYTGDGSFSKESFAFSSENSSLSLYTAAHVSGIGANSEYSGWIAPSGPAPVPEPATMVLFGSGLIALVGFGRKRLRMGTNP